MLSVYLSVHGLQVLCNIFPWDVQTHTGLTLFVCYMDACIEFLKGLVSTGDCGSERVKWLKAGADDTSELQANKWGDGGGSVGQYSIGTRDDPKTRGSNPRLRQQEHKRQFGERFSESKMLC